MSFRFTQMVKVGLASAALVFAAQTAQAAPITVDEVGDSFTVVFDGSVDETAVPGLTAEASFEVTSYSANSVTFAVELENTTSAPLASRVSRIGFDTDPDLTSASATGDFDVAVLNGAFPNGFGNIDVCFKDGNQGTCQGGPGGPLTGETAVFSITLNFTDSIANGLTLDNFGVRYQSIVGTSLGTSGTGQGSVPGTPGTPGTPGGPGSPGDPTPVPEPASMLLIGSGLAGLALKRMRRPCA